MLHSVSRRSFLVSCFLSIASLHSASTSADPVEAAALQSAVDELKDCVLAAAPSEKNERSPDPGRVLAACQDQLSAVEVLLPNGAEEQVRAHIKSDIQDLLRGD